MLRLTIALIFLCSATVAHAEFRLYGEARLGAAGVRHSDIDFYPTFGSFSAGAFLYKNIGIEGFIDAELSADDNGIFELGVTRAAGAAVRFQSAPERGLHAYILLGYVDFGLEQKESGLLGDRTVSQSFEGLRFSLGVNQRLDWVPGLIFGAEYRNYYSNSGITVDGISLGLRFEML